MSNDTEQKITEEYLLANGWTLCSVEAHNNYYDHFKADIQIYGGERDGFQVTFAQNNIDAYMIRNPSLRILENLLEILSLAEIV
jgi:hypothetical protein